MDFNLSPDEEAFREEVREFLRENLPEGERDMESVLGMCAWNRLLLDQLSGESPDRISDVKNQNLTPRLQPRSRGHRVALARLLNDQG